MVLDHSSWLYSCDDESHSVRLQCIFVSAEYEIQCLCVFESRNCRKSSQSFYLRKCMKKIFESMEKPWPYAKASLGFKCTT